MEPISTSARRAVAKRDERHYSESDLEDQVGVTVGNGYLVTGNDDGELVATNYTGDFVMVVTGVTHTEDRVRGQKWYRHPEVGENEFFDNIRVKAEFYALCFENGGISTHSEPFDTVTIPRNGIRKFRRRKLQAAVREDVWVMNDPNEI